MVKWSEPRLSSLSTPSAIKPIYKNVDEKEETITDFTQYAIQERKLKKKTKSTKLLFLLMRCDYNEVLIIKTEI